MVRASQIGFHALLHDDGDRGDDQLVEGENIDDEIGRNRNGKEEADGDGEGDGEDAPMVDIEDVVAADPGVEGHDDTEFIIPQFDGGDGTAPRPKKLSECIAVHRDPLYSLKSSSHDF